MPALMEIFAAPTRSWCSIPSADDIDAAEQETDVTNHVFMQQNDGFLIIYTMVKDALLEKLGTRQGVDRERDAGGEGKIYNVTEDVMAILAAKGRSRDRHHRAVTQVPRCPAPTMSR